MMDAAAKNSDRACEIAEEFTRLYYQHVDNTRHLTSKLYMDTAQLIWNGNGVKGNDMIQKFLLDLPASNHNLRTLDAQPMKDNAVYKTTTYLIQACGDVTYQTDEGKKPFQQTFIIVATEGKWKISSDSFRLQVPYGKNK